MENSLSAIICSPRSPSATNASTTTTAPAVGTMLSAWELQTSRDALPFNEWFLQGSGNGSGGGVSAPSSANDGQNK